MADLEWTERWSSLRLQEAEEWAPRAALAARKLGAVAGVADYGCGWMNLERYLAPSVRYVPIDLVPRDARTIVCDFDVDELPCTDVPGAAALGLIGYLRRPEKFLVSMAQRHNRAVVSYKTTDRFSSQEARRSAGLVNDLSGSQIDELLRWAGWTIEDVQEWNIRQTIWTLSR